MVIPEREKKVKSFRIPRIIFHSALLGGAIIVILIGILSYDYSKIIKQVYQNKHLSTENRQLRDQIQVFQSRINGLTDDIERIRNIEFKIRTITGLRKVNLQKPLKTNFEINEYDDDEADLIKNEDQTKDRPTAAIDQKIFNEQKMLQDSKYINLKASYEDRITQSFGQSRFSYTKEWSELAKKSFNLAPKFAKFDYQYLTLKNIVDKLEVDINQLDQHLLDRKSFINSTPTLMPSNGWITSYFGPRLSPYSGRMKMHEGLDIGAPTGTPILAPADGIITYSGRKPGFGKFIQINHGYGVESTYAHAHKLFVKQGIIVKRGELIAEVGNTGNSTGPHLHYEIRVNEIPVDPLYYILD
jgi:murein DD-endopeptidase MepM/ murein hydrolase activator NlpD